MSNSDNKTEKVPCWVGLLILLVGNFAAAQELANRIGRDFRLDNEEMGISIGSARLDLALSASGTYDSNVFATNIAEVDDKFYTVRPEVQLRSASSTFDFKLSAGSEFIRYPEIDSENHDNHTLNGNVDWLLSSDTSIGFGVAYTAGHENRFDAEERRGLNRTDLDEMDAVVRIRTGALRARIDGEIGYRENDYGASELLPDVFISNDERDYKESFASLAVGWRFDAAKVTPFLRFVAKNRDFYKADINPLFLNRSSETVSAHIGIRMPENRPLTGELYAGYTDISFDDISFNEDEGVVFGGNLTWWPSRLTSIGVDIAREVAATTVVGAGARWRTAVFLDINHELRRNMNLFFSVGYDDDEYIGVDRTDDALVFIAGLDVARSDHFRIGLDISYRDRDTSTADAGFQRATASLTVRGRL